MKRFEDRVFRDFYDRDSGRVFSNYEFIRCQFESCAVSITIDPATRSILQNIRISDCVERGCAMEAAILREVSIENLRTGGVFQVWAAAFQHVTMRGKIGKVMISHLVAPGRATLEQQRLFENENEKIYSNTDWALDISKAEFSDCTIWGVPAALIKRDVSTQAVIKREKAMRGDWRTLDLSGTYWKTSLEEFLRYGFRDVVLVAPKAHKNFVAFARSLDILRRYGVAEPT